LYDLQNSVTSILEWQKHILRSSQQEQAKQHIISMVDDKTVYWLGDWGMKMLPQKYRETMKDWFGKKASLTTSTAFLCWMAPNLKK
jgi:hypothetical protein